MTGRMTPTFHESLWNLTVFIILILVRRKKFIRQGDLFAGYIAMYSLGRVFVESFRTDSLMLGPFRIAQLVSLIGIAFGLIFIIYNHRKNQEPQAQETTKRRS